MDKIGKYQLQSHNPWWLRQELVQEDNKIVEFEQQKYKWHHPFYYNFPLQEDAILTLRGPRQVGKTTFLKLLIRHLLLEVKIPRQAVFFYPCDRIADYNELYDLLTEYLNFVQARENSRLFIFLDEISFVKEWQRAIKSLADSGKLKNVVLLLTGSNVLDIQFSSERLPGRRGKIFRPDIEIQPLDFSDFLGLVMPDLREKKIGEVFSLHFAQLQKLFEDFLLTGGFLVNINNYYSQGFIPAYIYDLYRSWIEGDLHKTGKSDEVALRIFERLFIHLTTPTSYYKLAKESGVVSHLTVRDYLDILEKIFVLFKVEYFSIEQRRIDAKKNRKVYFDDPFILQVIIASFENFLDDAFNYSQKTFLRENLRPKIAEMLVGSVLKRKYSQTYYGSCALGEVDFVVREKEQYLFFEVKYQRNLGPEDFYKYKNLLKKITVITKNNLAEEKEIKLIPLEIFLGFKEEFI
ncbi:MAG: ATP-binding protein [Elusimicrobiota bacterium]